MGKQEHVYFEISFPDFSTFKLHLTVQGPLGKFVLDFEANFEYFNFNLRPWPFGI